METNIITIGNSKGIIIPAKLLKSIGFQSNVNITVEDGKLIITPSEKIREGWADLMKSEIEKNGQPNRLIPDFFEDEQDNDWQW
jgi:antitoxin MazE